MKLTWNLTQKDLQYLCIHFRIDSIMYCEVYDDDRCKTSVTIHLFTGPAKYNIVLELPENSCEVLTVQHLMDKVVEVFEIPHDCQKLVCKG